MDKSYKQTTFRLKSWTDCAGVREEFITHVTDFETKCVTVFTFTTNERGGWGIKIDTSYQNWYLTPLSPFNTTLTAPVRSILAVPSAKDYIAAVRPEYFLTFTTNERGEVSNLITHPLQKNIQCFANKRPKFSDYYGVGRMGILIWFRPTNNPPSH